VGAGGNDISKATNVGTWVATANAIGKVSVMYSLTGPYQLSEVHVDLACLPIDKCAPGSYTFGIGGLSTKSYTSPPLQYPACGGSSQAALIIHAAVDVVIASGTCPSTVAT
jgi:hypothetical protein